MKQNNMLAMILAGGRGTRLHELTKKVAKPAVLTEENIVLSTSPSATAQTAALMW